MVITSAQGQTRLSVTCTSYDPMRIFIDEREYNSQNNTLTMDNLAPGVHTVKFVPVNRRRGDMPFFNSVILKTGYYSDVVVNRFGRTLTDEQLLNYLPVTPSPPPPVVNNPRCISDDSYAKAYEAIRRESFDKTRITIARQIADANYFNTTQVKELAKLFAFEDSRLDFVKYMYARTLDTNNYFVLNEVFSFSKSKEDLAEYIRNFR